MHELVRQPLNAVEAGEHEPSEELLDDRGIERDDRVKLAVLAEAAFGEHGVDVRMEVGERSESLDREQDGWTEIVSLEGRIAGLADRVVGAGATRA